MVERPVDAAASRRPARCRQRGVAPAHQRRPALAPADAPVASAWCKTYLVEVEGVVRASGDPAACAQGSSSMTGRSRVDEVKLVDATPQRSVLEISRTRVATTLSGGCSTCVGHPGDPAGPRRCRADPARRSQGRSRGASCSRARFSRSIALSIYRSVDISLTTHSVRSAWRSGWIESATTGGGMAVRALRGATQVDVDERDAVIAATAELVLAVLDRNGLTHDALISIIFTTTPDLIVGVPGVRRAEHRDHRRAVPVRLGDRRPGRDGADRAAAGPRRGRLLAGRCPPCLPARCGRSCAPTCRETGA